MKNNYPNITLAEFTAREKEFRGNLAAISLMMPRSPEWRLFHIEDIAHDDVWLTASDDKLPRGTIYCINDIGGYLCHEDALFMLYGSRQMLKLKEHLRARYTLDGPTAIARVGAVRWLEVLPHDTSTYSNPVQTHYVDFVLKIKATKVTVYFMANKSSLTMMHYINGEQASFYKLRWNFFSDADYISTVIARVESLDAI